MSLKMKFFLTVAGLFAFIIYIFATCALIIWFNLDLDERAFLSDILADRLGIIVIFTFFLLIGVGSTLDRLFKIYMHATRLHEETQLILTANPDHRITPEGPSETRQLAHVINTFAERHQSLQLDVETKIRAARADLEEEKDILAALMSELAQGVLVCNIEGQILLYNHRARLLLSPTSEKVGQNGIGGLIGLGRSIFAIIDRNIIVHALEHVLHQISQDVAGPVSTFVTTAKGGQLVRVNLAPVRRKEQDTSGFVLTLEDITRRIEVSSRNDIMMQSMVEMTRSSLANIRAAIETILEYPDMGRDRLGLFTRIIREESIALGSQIDKMMRESTEAFESQWPLEDMQSSDLIWAIQRRLEHKLGVTIQVEAVDETIWMRIDSYSVVQAVTYVISRVCDEANVRTVSLNLQRSGRFVRIDLGWQGAPISAETLRSWETQAMVTDGEGSPMTLKAVAERHKGEIWCQSDARTETTYFRLLLPVVQPEQTWNVQIASEVAPGRRPEYYDFDLFGRLDQPSELDDRRLLDLAYTVFDTETTGLNPSEGDEIIAIGAIRILNGRLLRQEIFDQLVDPQRTMSRMAISIHGISPGMLEGQPTITAVLPGFHQFAEDTVLVAHNAAFDMRFLQMKEAATGLKFIHPVLDTLLLSAVVNPHQDDHSLEAIAHRLGVHIIGRHTALGDAIVTGEVFLKLVPMLAEHGIYTLKQAREAAQQTYFAMIEY